MVPQGVRLMFQKEAKMEPEWGPMYAKIEDKTDQNRRQKRRRKNKLLKIVLEPSWVDLGSSWVPSWGQNRALARAALVFLKIDFWEKMRVQEATWVDLGSIWVAQGGQNEGRVGSKEELS